MKILTCLYTLLFSSFLIGQNLTGAWASSTDKIQSVWIMTSNHFSITQYETDPTIFISTAGGSWDTADDDVVLNWEFDTSSPENVGTQTNVNFIQSEENIQWENTLWGRIDNGQPGALQGAWLITGREREGVISERVPGVRRTMKILSGTQF